MLQFRELYFQKFPEDTRAYASVHSLTFFCFQGDRTPSVNLPFSRLARPAPLFSPRWPRS